MGHQRVKKMKKEYEYVEPTKEAAEYEKQWRRKMRQLREQQEESVYPPQPWYEADGT